MADWLIYTDVSEKKYFEGACEVLPKSVTDMENYTQTHSSDDFDLGTLSITLLIPKF